MKYNMLKNIGGVISKNSPTILTSMAVAGVITTIFTAIKATPKAMIIIDDYLYNIYMENIFQSGKTFNEWKKDHEVDKRDIIALTWREYIPTIAIGLATIACIIGSNHISLRRNAALASVYTLTETAFREYKSKVIETIGDTKEQKIRDDISADRIKNKPSNTDNIIVTSNGNLLCFDTLSGREFRSNIEKIRRVVNELNYTLLSSMFLSVNELYYKLGLDDIKLGDQMGWHVDGGMIEIHFSTQLSENDEPCLVLNYNIEPKFYK